MILAMSEASSGGRRGAEGRRHSRREAGGFTITCYRAEEGRSLRGRKNFGVAVLDISAGGARLGVTEPLAGGIVLTVEIRETATGELFHARATVRWCDSKTVGGVERHTIGVKWDEIFTAVGKRDRFFYGKDGAAKAMDLRDRLPSERMPAPVETSKPPMPQGEVRFQVDDYEVKVTRTGLFASRRNLARTVASLSNDGAQVECGEKLAVGTKVRFALLLNKFADTFEAPAEVVWSKEPAGGGGHLTGLVFGKVNPAQRRLLEYMMSWFTSYQAKYRQSHR